jgi:ferredoxin
VELAIDITLIGFGFFCFIGFFAFGLLSFHENAGRAALISIALGLVLSILSFLAIRLPPDIKSLLVGALGLVIFFLAASATFPFKGKHRLPVNRDRRFDERDVVFSRARLQSGTKEFNNYYAMRPENLTIDDKFRAQPGLLSMDARKAEFMSFSAARKAEFMSFSAAEASFDLTEYVREAVDGPIAPEKTKASAKTLSRLVRGFTTHLGAHNVGVTELKPEHVYSHIGRGSGNYGDPIDLNHRYAIAFSVEMDYEMMGRAPEAPVVMESARKYVDGAVIAIQVANLCRRLGYAARAHIDGNYRVIAPLVARDAGLGEIGRIGILMTPRLGPRVRLGVVTTDLPLIVDPAGGDASTLAFCEICVKCAENCPSRAISFGEREGAPGGKRWKLDEDKCFHYWNVIGTDCGLCMTVCPYSHPDNWAHNIVRRLLQRSTGWMTSSMDVNLICDHNQIGWLF